MGKRSNTLDPSVNLSSFASSSMSPSRSKSNRLTPKSIKGRATKSKSPSKYKTKDKKTRNKKRSRSDAPTHETAKSMQIRTLLPIDDLLPTDDQIKKKKSAKHRSKTPVTDYVGLQNISCDDPFGVNKKNRNKKKRTMTPIVSLSETVKGPSFGSDDELNAHHSNRSMSARYSTKENVSTNAIVSSSKCISAASKSIDCVKQSVTNQINDGFESFHNALDEQENKLLNDLETVYDDKKDSLTNIEKKLYENA